MTGKLRTETAFPQPDAFYNLLLEAHEGLSEQQSAVVNAKFILLLANHIGDLDVIREALELARANP
jgi:hypothetical protein